MTAFTIDAGTFSSAAAWVARVIPPKPAVPVLGGILVDVGETELRLTAYDYETAATVALPLMLGEPGRMLLSGRLLSDVAAAAVKSTRKTPDITITGGHPAVATAGRTVWELPALPVEDYPQLPGVDLPPCEMPAADLSRALHRVMPVAERGGEYPVFGGVQFSPTEDALTVTATDRWRLATTVIPGKWAGLIETLAAAVPTRTSALIPAELLDIALKALTGGQSVQLGSDGSTVVIATDDRTLTGRCIAAEFPRWQGLMPAGRPDATVVVSAAALAQAVQQVSVMLESARQMLRLDFRGGEMEVSAAGEDRSACAYAELDECRGDPPPVGVNAHYLGDALTGVGTELVEIQFGADSNRPLLLLPAVTGEDEPVDEYRHLLMPIRLP